jgi:uncharacterized protein with von Willebrand factor type A (vWA) domain
MLLDGYDKETLKYLPEFLGKYFRRYNCETKELRGLLGLQKKEKVYDTLWGILYKVYPIWKRDDQGKLFLEALRRTDAFYDIRMMTISDLAFTHLGVERLARALQDMFKGGGGKGQKLSELLQKALQKVLEGMKGDQKGEGEGEGQEKGPSEGEGQEEVSPNEQELRNKPGGKSQGHERGNDRNTPRGEIDSLLQQISQSLSGALEETRRELDDCKEITDMAEEGKRRGREVTASMTSPKEKLKLVERLKNAGEAIKQIAKITGKLRLLRASKRKEITDFLHIMMTDITHGSELSDMVDLTVLADEDQFRRDFLEGELVIAKRRGKGSLGEGPIVFCVDESGSMDGQNEDWSKVVLYSIFELANDQHRSMWFVPFESQVKEHDCKKLTPEFAMSLLTHRRATGGTSFTPPIRKAVEIISTKKAFRRADIIFITDGCASVSSSVMKDLRSLMRSKNVHLYLIIIGGGGHGDIEKVADAKFVFDGHKFGEGFSNDSELLDKLFKI